MRDDETEQRSREFSTVAATNELVDGAESACLGEADNALEVTGGGPIPSTNFERRHYRSFVVLSPLGRGGMGVVYAGYDPELDRKVALKLVLIHDGIDLGDQTRLLREAQALAQLAHPNVVNVFDVGYLAGRIWIAMEFIDGQTLSNWLMERPRSWRDILPVFLRAGDGLHAAHTVGLVHRDFKPDNIMFGNDGRVRVMDFGLARAEWITTKDLPPTLPSLRDRTAFGNALTHAEALLGTPRYMAPEQMESHSHRRTNGSIFVLCIIMGGSVRCLAVQGGYLGRIGCQCTCWKVRRSSPLGLRTFMAPLSRFRG